MYYTKKECYTDTLLSLKLGIINEEDLKDLLNYYRDNEHYECCSGLVEAYAQYKKEKKQIKDEESSFKGD